MIWGMFMAVTMESATFMGKNFQDNQNSIVNTAGLTLKQMFDISAKLVSEQEVKTLFQKTTKHHNQEDGSRETPMMEVTTSYLHGKHGVEIRIMSLSRDNTDSWVRISHGSNK